MVIFHSYVSLPEGIIEYLGISWSWHLECDSGVSRQHHGINSEHFFVAPGQPQRLEASGTEGMQQIGRHLPGQGMPRDAKGAPERRWLSHSDPKNGEVEAMKMTHPGKLT